MLNDTVAHFCCEGLAEYHDLAYWNYHFFFTSFEQCVLKVQNKTKQTNNKTKTKQHKNKTKKQNKKQNNTQQSKTKN